MYVTVEPALHREAQYTEQVELTGNFRGSLNSPENDNYCQFEVAFRDAQGNVLELRWIPFNEEELATWGDDDSVLVTLILAKLQLTAVPQGE